MTLLTVEDYIAAKLTESVHTSSRRSFRGCRRRYNYIFRNFWYPTVTPKPLEFGVAYHKAMEVMYSPETWHDKKTAVALALVAFRHAVEEQREKYRATIGELSEEEEADYNERVELGLGMLKYYAKKMLPYERLKPIEVEIPFEVPIKHSDGRELWCKCDNCWDRFCKSEAGKEHIQADIDNRRASHTCRCTSYPDGTPVQYAEWADNHWKGLPVTLGGRIDVLMQDEDGGIWIGDWKTAARIVEEGKDFFLQLDDQITSYCWALWILGLDVAGFLYMEIKKGFPKEPEPLLRPYKGRLYSTNKMNEVDYDKFRTTIEENDPNGFQNGLYEEYLDWLQEQGPTYHYRHQQHRSEEELAIAGDYIFLEAADMVDPNLRIYPSPGRFTCNFCAFQEPCMAEMRGDDTNYLLTTSYEKRSYHYWEKKQPSTESKGGE